MSQSLRYVIKDTHKAMANVINFQATEMFQKEKMGRNARIKPELR
jgi:ribosomal protein S6